MCESLAVAACLRCGTSEGPLVCLAARGLLESVCQPCFHVAEVSRLLQEVRGATARATAALSLEEIYTFLRAERLRELQRDGSEESQR